MNAEKRNVQASLFAGVTEIVIGVVMALTGWGTWYFEHFHFFGILGVGFILYAYYYCLFYRRDTSEAIWKKKKK